MRAVSRARTVRQGNEAVQLMPDGTKRVETPPLPTTGPIQVDQALRRGRELPWWRLADAFETQDGLLGARKRTRDRAPAVRIDHGTTRLLRLWVVKSGGAWLQCQLPDIASRCVNMAARPPANLPYPAVR